MSLIYYIVLGITAFSYLLGLFLSYCEKKGKTSLLTDAGQAGFINTLDNNSYVGVLQSNKPMMYQKGFSQNGPYMDEEII